MIGVAWGDFNVTSTQCISKEYLFILASQNYNYVN